MTTSEVTKHDYIQLRVKEAQGVHVLITWSRRGCTISGKSPNKNFRDQLKAIMKMTDPRGTEDYSAARERLKTLAEKCHTIEELAANK